MDARLEKLNIAVVESSRASYIAISDGQIESELMQFAGTNATSIQNALTKALLNYKEKIRQLEAPFIEVNPEDVQE